MDNEDKKLLVETLAELRELRGEMREFKEHVIGRVEKLEKEAEQGKEKLTVVSILISAAALTVSIIVNLFKHGGK